MPRRPEGRLPHGRLQLGISEVTDADGHIEALSLGLVASVCSIVDAIVDVEALPPTAFSMPNEPEASSLRFAVRLSRIAPVRLSGAHTGNEIDAS